MPKRAPWPWRGKGAALEHLKPNAPQLPFHTPLTTTPTPTMIKTVHGISPHMLHMTVKEPL